MEHFINYGRHWIGQDDIDAVTSVLSSDHLTQGPKVKEFEDTLCAYTGAKYCVVVSNGTAALQIAVQALQLNEGCSGITSTNTFVASSNALIYNKIRPILADIDPLSLNISVEDIQKRLLDNTTVIIPVHFAGRPCEMEEICKFARSKNLHIIEDAAHAIGSHYSDGSKVGNCRYSDMTVFSFHPVKTVATGEGGAIMTNTESLYERLLLYRSHGIIKNPNFLIEDKGPWYYEMQELGHNYRLTDIQAALGISQLKKVNCFKERRSEIVKAYSEGFSGLNYLKVPKESNNSCFHLYVVQIEYNEIGLSRELVMKWLKKNNIGTQVHYIPVHTHPYYRRNYGFKWGDYPIAEAYYKRALSLPLYPMMEDDDINHVIDKVRAVTK